MANPNSNSISNLVESRVISDSEESKFAFWRKNNQASSSTNNYRKLSTDGNSPANATVGNNNSNEQSQKEKEILDLSQTLTYY